MHVKQVSRGLAVLLLLVTAGYMMHTYPQFPDRVPMQWDGNDEPTRHAGKKDFFLTFGAGVLALTCLFCFLIPRATTAMAGVLLNLVALFGFHLVAAQVVPKPLFFLPVDVGTSIILAASGVGMLIILIYGIKSGRAKPSGKEA